MQADAESNEAAQSVMSVLKGSHAWLEQSAEEPEDEAADPVARVASCMADERVPLQEKQNVVQARGPACPSL